MPDNGEIICAEKRFGSGCDFMRLDGRIIANLFEVKQCHLSLTDATRAIKELNQTREHVRRESLVSDGCKFNMFLIHVKKGNCRTDAIAAILLESNSVRLLRSDDETIVPFYRKYLESCG
jgi:hypothetical protein